MTAANTNTATKFEAGRTYWTRSICDSECIHRVTIEKRTAKSVWIKRNGQLTPRCRGIPRRRADLAAWQVFHGSHHPRRQGRDVKVETAPSAVCGYRPH